MLWNHTRPTNIKVDGWLFSAVWRTRLLGFCIPLAGLCGSTYAQQTGFFNLSESRHGFLEFRIKDRQEKRIRPQNGFPDWDSGNLEFAEILRLDLSGSIYHPRFMEFQVGLMPEFQQDYFSGSAAVDGERQNRFLLGGDFRVTFLKEHPYTLSLFGSKQEVDVDRDFARSFLLKSDILGASFSFRKGPLPFTASYSESNQKGFGAGADIDESRNDFRVDSRYNIRTRSRGNIEFQWDETWEEVRQRLFTRRGFYANNTADLDAAARKRLTSNLLAQRQTGYTQTETLLWRENLSWRHTKSLGTQYNLSFNQNDTEGQTTDTWEGRGRINHQLYDSLSSEGELYCSFQEASFGDIDRWGGSAEESYSKRLSGWGLLGVSLRGFSEILDQQPNQLFAEVFDEPHVLNGEIPVRLEQFDIDSGSIVMTDDRGIIEYIEDLDYRVIVREPVTEIARLALGSIPDGSVVLIDYRYRLAAASKIQSTGGNFGIRLNTWETFAFYFQLDRVKQNQLEGLPGVRLEDLNRKVGGFRTNWRWLGLGAELEDRQSTFSPYKAHSEWISLSFKPSQRWSAMLSTSYRDQRYTDETDQIKSWNVYGMLTTQVTHRGFLELEARYRRDRWNEEQEVNNLDDRGIKLSFNYWYEAFEIEAGGRLSDIEQRNEKENTSRLFVSFRRRF